DALRDVEPETLAPPVVLAHLPEPLEDRLQHRSGNSHAGVADAEPKHASGRFDPDDDLASGRGELDRVRDEVGEDLKHPIVIELREEGAVGDLRRERDALFESGGP